MAVFFLFIYPYIKLTKTILYVIKELIAFIINFSYGGYDETETKL